MVEERPLSKQQQRPPSSLDVLDPLSILPAQPLNREDYLLLWRLWEMLQIHPHSGPFRGPIDAKIYPNYTKVIQKPMGIFFESNFKRYFKYRFDDIASKA